MNKPGMELVSPGVWVGGMEGENGTYGAIAARCGGHVLVGLLDQHAGR